jgi:RNA polymerase-binding transcription factor DksA
MEATIMSGNSRIRLIEIPVGGTGGRVWNRLHSEREDICEAMLTTSQSGTQGTSKDDDISTANWRCELLQGRLRKIDDALDRLMSGSFGKCSRCGGLIRETDLDFDPAIAFCIECWGREESQRTTAPFISVRSQTTEQANPKRELLNPVAETHSSPAGVALQTLVPFDTIWVRTLNSDYRILLLDPATGRSLVAGDHFVEPEEAMLYGSTLNGYAIKVGWIGIGFRIEMSVDDKLISTSPVQAVRVEHRTVAETAAAISAA